MSAVATRADCAVRTPVLLVATWSYGPSGVPAQHKVAQNHWEPCMKQRDKALEELQQCLRLGSSCSPQPVSLGRMNEKKSPPAPLDMSLDCFLL